VRRLVLLLAIKLTPAVTARLLGVPHLQPQRFGPTALFAFAPLLGFGGSFSSLAPAALDPGLGS